MVVFVVVGLAGNAVSILLAVGGSRAATSIPGPAVEAVNDALGSSPC